MWTRWCSACLAACLLLSTEETEAFFQCVESLRLFGEGGKIVCLETRHCLRILSWDAAKKPIRHTDWLSVSASNLHSFALANITRLLYVSKYLKLLWPLGFIIQRRPWETKHLFWPCIVFFISFSFLSLIQIICFGLISFFTGLTAPSIEVLYLSMNRACQYKAPFHFHPSMCFQSDLGGIFSGVKAQQGLHASISYLAFLTQLTRVLIIAI